MIRSLLIALALHVLLLSTIWVGFPVPWSRNRVQFAYSTSAQPAEAPQPADNDVILRTQDPSLFGPWLKMRDVNKPRD